MAAHSPLRSAPMGRMQGAALDGQLIIPVHGAADYDCAASGTLAPGGAM
jgi:hypothetical protein